MSSSRSRLHRSIIKNPEKPIMHYSAPGTSASPSTTPESDYESMSSEEALRHLNTYKQGTVPAYAYYRKFENLVSAAYGKTTDQLTDKETLEHLLKIFVDGLRDGLREIVQQYNCTNVSHARRIAIHQELYISFYNIVHGQTIDDRFHKVEIVCTLQNESIKHLEGKMNHQNQMHQYEFGEIKGLLRGINDRLVKDDAAKVSERHLFVTEIREGISGMRDKLMADFSTALEHRFQSSLKYTLREEFGEILDEHFGKFLEKKIDDKLEKMMESLESKLEKKISEKLQPLTNLQIPDIEEKFEEVQYILDHNYECTRKTFKAVVSGKEASKNNHHQNRQNRPYRSKSPMVLRALKSDFKRNNEKKEKERERSPTPRDRRERKRERERDSDRESSNITPPVKLPNLAPPAPRSPVRNVVPARDPSPVAPPQSLPNRILPAQTQREFVKSAKTPESRRRSPRSPSPYSQRPTNPDKILPAKTGLFTSNNWKPVQNAPPFAPPGIKAPCPVPPPKSVTPPPPGLNSIDVFNSTQNVQTYPSTSDAPPKNKSSYPEPQPAKPKGRFVVAEMVPVQDGPPPSVAPQKSTTPPISSVLPNAPGEFFDASMIPVESTQTIIAAPEQNGTPPPSSDTQFSEHRLIPVKLEPLDDYGEGEQYYPPIDPLVELEISLMEKNVNHIYLNEIFHRHLPPLTQLQNTIENLRYTIEKGGDYLSEGDRKSKEPCWFCKCNHHSVFCNIVISVEERKSKLADRNCQKCFKNHYGECRYNLACKFCKKSGAKGDELAHHIVLCPIHEQFEKDKNVLNILLEAESSLKNILSQN